MLWLVNLLAKDAILNKERTYKELFLMSRNSEYITTSQIKVVCHLAAVVRR